MRNKLFQLSIGIWFVALAACNSTGEPESPTTSPIPTISPTPGYIRTKNVQYKTGQMMDIYAPSQPGDYPVVIAFHGGEPPRHHLDPWQWN